MAEDQAQIDWRLMLNKWEYVRIESEDVVQILTEEQAQIMTG